MRVAVYSPLCQRLLGVIDSGGGVMNLEPSDLGQGSTANRAALARLLADYDYAGNPDAVIEEIVHKIPAVSVVLQEGQNPDPGIED